MKYKEKVDKIGIHISIPKDLEQLLNAYCSKYDIKRNDFIKESIKFYMKYKKQI